MEIRVNGVRVEVEEGRTLLHAAEKAGFQVPTLCYHPAVSAQGSCRVCVVEEEGSGDLLTACDTPVREGMSILLDTERVVEARREAVRLIFSAHPVHCEVCEAANSCRLKELASGLGLSGRELPFLQDFRPVVDANPFYLRNLSKCISCRLCVRACQEVQGVGNYEMLGRGGKARPGTVLDTHLEASVCEFCGLCASLCPVGTLFQRPFLHRGVEEKRVTTICPYCGVGCSLDLRVREGHIVEVDAGAENSVNGWSLCVKGRYGLDFVDHPDRLRKPLIRKEEGLVEVEWEEALVNLALLTGNLGKEGAGINPLRGQNNVQGACDMGALPNFFPGYQRVDDPETNRKFSQAWDFPSQAHLRHRFRAAHQGGQGYAGRAALHLR